MKAGSCNLHDCICFHVTLGKCQIRCALNFIKSSNPVRLRDTAHLWTRVSAAANWETRGIFERSHRWFGPAGTFPSLTLLPPCRPRPAGTRSTRDRAHLTPLPYLLEEAAPVPPCGSPSVGRPYRTASGQPGHQRTLTPPLDALSVTDLGRLHSTEVQPTLPPTFLHWFAGRGSRGLHIEGPCGLWVHKHRICPWTTWKTASSAARTSGLSAGQPGLRGLKDSVQSSSGAINTLL